MPGLYGTIQNGGYVSDLKYRNIESGEVAIYQAINQVNLLPGFSVMGGGIFLAEIIECPSLCSINSTAEAKNNVPPLTVTKSYTENSENLITNSISDFQFNIFPNPFQSSITIQISMPEEEDFSISTYSSDGKQIGLINGKAQIGSFDFDYNLTSLNPGIYFCVFNSKSFTKTIQIVKK